MHAQIAGLLRECSKDIAYDLIGDRDLDLYVSKLLQRAELLTFQQGKELSAIVAFYANDFESKTAFITLVAVRPKHQGVGIASSLLRSALTISFKRGFRRCQLEVAANNSRAIQLYSSMGFTEIRAKDDKLILEVTQEDFRASVR